MATRAELESEFDVCHAKTQRAIKAEKSFDYHNAITFALQTFPFMDSALQFERKFIKREKPLIRPIRIILEYAPPLFRRDAIDQLQQLINGKKRIERISGQDLKSQIAHARDQLAEAAALWDRIEARSQIENSEVSKNKRWRSIIEIWNSSGLVARRSSGQQECWVFRTRFGEKVHAKCTSCGHLAFDRKSQFLSDYPCSRCKAVADHVILISE